MVMRVKERYQAVMSGILIFFYAFRRGVGQLIFRINRFGMELNRQRMIILRSQTFGWPA
jgi:hypothetical protein